MAKRKHHPGHNLGQWLHPAKGKKPMATPPMSAASAAPPADPTADLSMSGGDAGDGGTEGDVLCTILKNADGTYTLIDGDEDDGDTSDGSADGGAGDAGGDSAGQQFDSVGGLLKAILDLLKEDESSDGADGSSGDQFQAGYDESAPAAPAGQLPQKY